MYSTQWSILRIYQCQVALKNKLNSWYCRSLTTKSVVVCQSINNVCWDTSKNPTVKGTQDLSLNNSKHKYLSLAKEHDGDLSRSEKYYNLISFFFVPEYSWRLFFPQSQVNFFFLPNILNLIYLYASVRVRRYLKRITGLTAWHNVVTWDNFSGVSPVTIAS